MFKPLTGPVGHLLRSSPGYRVVSSAAATVTNNETIAADYDLARPYKEMPKITFLSMMWDTIKDPTVKLKMDRWIDGFFRTHGPIYRVWIPGLGDRVFIKDPKDIQTLLVKDGKYLSVCLPARSVTIGKRHEWRRTDSVQ